MRTRPTLITLAVLTVTLMLAGCRVGETRPNSNEGPPEVTPPTEPGSETPPDEPWTPPPGAVQRVGVLHGDAELEGGVLWLMTDLGDRYQIVWPDGYRADRQALEIYGPEGRVAARAGDTLEVWGFVQKDVMTIGMVGTPFRALRFVRR